MAHSENELRIPLLHKHDPGDEDFRTFLFKTVLCPFPEPHRPETCVYAHGWADFRRNPSHVAYRTTPCPYWQ
jgi:hypothetical protein